jgi:hypothetical protein
MQEDKYQKSRSSREVRDVWIANEFVHLRCSVAGRLLRNLRGSGTSRVLDRLLLTLGLMYESSGSTLNFDILVGIYSPVYLDRRIFFFVCEPSIASQWRAERGARSSWKRDVVRLLAMS